MHHIGGVHDSRSRRSWRSVLVALAALASAAADLETKPALGDDLDDDGRRSGS